jgi:hypothetical protein
MGRASFPRLSWSLALLLAWTALLTFLSSLWARPQFELPPAWDHALYLSTSLRFHRSLEEGGALALARQVLLKPSPVAPLFPLTTVPLYRVLGESREVAQLALAPYLFLLLLSTALLSWGSGASPPEVALSVFLASTFTGVVNFTREYTMDLPAAALATIGLWALFRKGPGILAGFLAGVTLLTKVLAGVFFAGPLVYLLFSGERRKIATFAAAFVATSGLWLAPHFTEVVHYVRYFGFAEGSLPFRSSSHPGYYFMILLTQGMGWLLSAALLPPLVLSFRRSRPDGLFVAWIASGYLLLALLPNKGGERYVLALLPPIAVLGAHAISTIDGRTARSVFVSLAVLAGILNYAGITWPFLASVWTHDHFRPFPHSMTVEARELRGWPTSAVLRALSDLREGEPSPSEIERFVSSTSSLEDADFVRAAYRRWLKREPDSAGLEAYLERLKDARRSRVVESLTRSDEFRSRPLRVLVVPDHRVFNAATLQYLAESERRSLSFRHAAKESIVQQADAAILKDGGPQGPWPNSAISPEVLEAVERRARDRASFPCPDGSSVLVLPLER